MKKLGTIRILNWRLIFFLHIHKMMTQVEFDYHNQAERSPINRRIFFIHKFFDLSC